VSSIPFSLKRPWLLLRDYLWVDRDRPDLIRLSTETEPDRFLWAILPHAARTFSSCIAMLPGGEARAAAVGYLYCRMLDTYEDLHPESGTREEALRAFATRLEDAPLPPAPPIPNGTARDERDLGHLLLVERCSLVDRVFEKLEPRQKSAIRDLVRDMAEGMCWSSHTFERQGGVLESEEQLARYCRNVLGHPVVFTLRLLTHSDLSPDLHEDAMLVGEMIQLANVTRDIEKDLARGIAYHPDLRPCLLRPRECEGEVRRARAELVALALHHAPAYGRMVRGLDRRRFSLARASALLMLLFTSRYFSACARRVGLGTWRGPHTAWDLWIHTFPAFVSRRWTYRTIARIERAFLTAASTCRS
jgi:phytoene/squalene synthetase